MKKIFRLESSGINPYVLMSFAMLVVGFSVTRIADYDFWWHINLGRAVIEKLTISPVDTFSYTFSGTRQFSSEWLADCVTFLLFRSGGFLGVNVLKVILLLATFTLLMKTHQLLGDTKNRTWFYSSIVTLVITLFALRFRLFIRPYLFSFLFLSAFMYLITRYDMKNERKVLIILPLVELLWANLSKGAFYGPFVISCYLAWALYQKKGGVKDITLVLVTTVAASLVNPETYNIYSMIFGFAANARDAVTVGEHQPLSPQILWGYGLGYTLGYQLLVVGSALYFIFFRGWKNIFHILLFTAFFIPSLLMVRMIDFFSIVGCVFTFKAVQGAGESLFAALDRHRVLTASVFSAGLILILIVTVPANATYSFGLGVKEEKVPEGAISFLDREGIRGRVFNSYAFGGYIPWRSPERKVFIDGRVNQLFPPAFHKEYFRIIEDPTEWKKAEDSWNFNIAVIEYDLKSQWQHFPKHLVENPDWALVYWDNHSLVYLKRTPERVALIKRFEYRTARPTFLDLSYLDAYQGGTLNEALSSLEREVALNPDNQYVLLARVYLRYQLGKLYLPQIQADLEKVLPMKPDFAMKHSALAMLLASTGDKDRARSEVEKALRLNPLDDAALAQAKEMGIKVKIPKGNIPGHP
jgi:tetratricopeptide (TPR) repeat protein